MGSRSLASRLLLPAGMVAAALLLLASPVRAMAADVPATPLIVSPVRSALVSSTFVITGRVDSRTTDVHVAGAQTADVSLSPADSTGATFTAAVRVGYAKTDISITAGAGGVLSGSATLTVWQLGKTPTAARFVLVDKSDFMLYVVRSRAVVASYPIATGTRATPTRTGTRYLGRPVRPGKGGPAWGPFRMRLYKKAWVRVSHVTRVGGRRVRHWRKVLKLVGTSYYIHGTNEPDSIGTPASHGCVRMWNFNLRVFRTLTYKYELTVIRN